MTIADIVAQIYKKTKTNSSSYVASDMLIDINAAYQRVVSLIVTNDARWQWDDTNNSDLAIATTALVANQQDYTVAVTHLAIDRVELLPNGANTTTGWVKLDQIDQQTKKRAEASSMGSYQPTAGTPNEYDLAYNSVFLYPKPSYAQAASLKIFYIRGPAEFTSAEVTTGTKVPGFASLFHDLIPLWVAYQYCADNEKVAKAGTYLAEIQLKEMQLEKFYGGRNRDFRGGLRAPKESNK